MVSSAFLAAIILPTFKSEADAEPEVTTVFATVVPAEAAAIAYQSTRQPLYPSLGEFADAMYWNSKGDSSKLTAYYAACEKVKTDNPKPS